MFGRIIGRLTQLFKVHRTRVSLGELTDEQLRDIGITRLQAERETARLPWDSDSFVAVGRPRRAVSHTSFSRR